MPCFPVLRPRFLEPLEEFPIVVPFPEANLLSSEPGALGLFNETPSTIDMSLPTPSIPVFAMFTDELPSPAQIHYDTPAPQSEAIRFGGCRVRISRVTNLAVSRTLWKVGPKSVTGA
jgi:hypothetical protein